jgi:transcriptional regulator with XRE-family HTH domain
MNDPIAMLKERLTSPDLTQADLATRIGISPQFLSEILKGKRNPSKTVLDFLGLEKHVTYLPRVSAVATGADRRSRNRRRA